MHIIAVSINHHSTPVEIRERFAFAEEQLPEALKQLKGMNSILEGVIVSTCNRMEIYAVVDRLHMCGHYIREFMETWFGVSRKQFVQYLNIYEDKDAIRHLFRVTCGLDSMIIGETQILGQIRSAFLLAQREKATGIMFNMLFKQAITLAKRSHTETSISDAAVSVSYAAVELGKRIFGNYRNKNVMIIGAGKMGELTVKHLEASGAGKIVVANRTLERARALAGRWKGVACSMEDVPDMLVKHDIDIIISSTGAQSYVLTREQTRQLLAQRHNKPLFMIDIAVPRDLDPAIAELDHAFLYDMDDLQAIVALNLKHREQEAEKVKGMIEDEIAAFEHWYKLLGVSPVIRALQEKAAAIHRETMESMMKKLPDLDEHELKVIRKLSKSIVNQMLHEPILRIKEMAAERNGEQSLRMFTQLFALEEWIDRGLDEAVQLVPEAEQTAPQRLQLADQASLSKLPAHS